MKYLFVFVSLSLPLCAQEIEVFPEKADTTINFYARSPYYCPYTVEVRFETLENMQSSVPLPASFVIEPLVEKQFLLSIKAKKGPGIRNWKYAFEYRFDQGNLLSTRHDNSYVYLLPYQSSRPHMLMQGYFGKFSHANTHALDFEMPTGTKVVAAREGMVVQVKEDSNEGGTAAGYLQKGNYVMIYHTDGTFASYFHLQQDGALVTVGQVVTRGELIGLSGNTGLSSAPHLHFEVLLPSKEGKQTVPTTFLLRNGNREQLQEGKSY
jgi:murein DD-endopeptidase MepM/ murein hydrolase activator NlpD